MSASSLKGVNSLVGGQRGGHRLSSLPSRTFASRRVKFVSVTKAVAAPMEMPTTETERPRFEVSQPVLALLRANACVMKLRWPDKLLCTCLSRYAC